MSRLSETELDPPPLVALTCLTRSGPRADAVRAVLELHGEGCDIDSAEFDLDWVDDALTLLDVREPRNQPLSIDWATPLAAMRSYPGSRKVPMGRALGRKTRTIIDATAGWGHDALRMVMMGYSVHMIERSPVIAALLVDGLRRLAEQTAIASTLADMPTVSCADSAVVLRDAATDCIYLDPMFPRRPKASVLSKRPVRVLGRLAGASGRGDGLLEVARAQSGRRVVVKRPDHIKAPNPAPSQTFAGKLVRYDVYLTQIRRE